MERNSIVYRLAKNHHRSIRSERCQVIIEIMNLFKMVKMKNKMVNTLLDKFMNKYFNFSNFN